MVMRKTQDYIGLEGAVKSASLYKAMFFTCGLLYVLVAWCVLVSCLVYSSALKMETLYSFGTTVDFHRTMQCNIPEDSRRC
jgi:hypothetical protein